MGWGPVDWSSLNQNWKINGQSFFNFFDLSDRYWDFCKKQFLGTSWMGWGPVDWVEKVLPEAKLKNKWTLFFELFDLSDLYIFEHLSLHIYFRAFKPSYTFLWVGRVLPEAKFEDRWTVFWTFLSERPLLTRDWKSESVTNQRTNRPTYMGRC